MKILELVEIAETMILQDHNVTDVMVDLSVEVQTQHEIDLKHAFNRGRASMMGTFMMDADQYYSKFYTDEI